MNPQAASLIDRYAHLWNEAVPAIRAGQVEIDPILADGTADPRRGFTLIARPDRKIQAAVGKFLEALKSLEAQQYYYCAEELHITILSLFTPTEQHARFAPALPRYRSAIVQALAGVQPFDLEFRGVTASVGAVMIQGFPRNAVLEEIRERLRSNLLDEGLGGEVDVRYRLVTAHVTVARFRSPLSDSSIFAEELARYREKPFGTCRLDKLALVQNDWCMSRKNLKILGQYPLPNVAGQQP